MASTFKSDDSLSSTDDIRTNPKLSNDKSESEVVSKAPKTSSSQPASLPVITFSFTQLSTANVCFTEQILLAAKLNAGCKIECVQSRPGFLEEKYNNALQYTLYFAGRSCANVQHSTEHYTMLHSADKSHASRTILHKTTQQCTA